MRKRKETFSLHQLFGAPLLIHPLILLILQSESLGKSLGIGEKPAAWVIAPSNLPSSTLAFKFAYPSRLIPDIAIFAVLWQLKQLACISGAICAAYCILTVSHVPGGGLLPGGGFCCVVSLLFEQE
jgi:hypothetical protein